MFYTTRLTQKTPDEVEETSHKVGLVFCKDLEVRQILPAVENYGGGYDLTLLCVRKTWDHPIPVQDIYAVTRQCR